MQSRMAMADHLRMILALAIAVALFGPLFLAVLASPVAAPGFVVDGDDGSHNLAHLLEPRNEIVCGLKYKLTTIPGIAAKDVSTFDKEMTDSARSTPPNPLSFFAKPTTIGKGGFGVVRLAALKGADPSPYDKSIDPNIKERVFVIKKSDFREALGVGHSLNGRVEIERRHAPKINAAVNGGPFIIKNWFTWTWPRAPSAPDGGKAEFSDIDYSLYSAVSPGTGDLGGEIAGKGKWFKKGFSKTDARDLIAKLALGIGYMHGKNVVHRDLKPENIIMSYTGEPMVADFGTAILSGDLDKWTGQDIVMMQGGDRRFTAPEIRAFECVGGEGFPERKAPYGRGSDWWSFGLISYFILIHEEPDGSADSFQNFPFTDTVLAGPKSFCAYSSSAPFLDDKKLAMIEDPVARDFIKQLLRWDPKKRLGRYSSNKLAVQGYQQVLCHPYLKSVSKKTLLQKGAKLAKDLNAPIVVSGAMNDDSSDEDWDELAKPQQSQQGGQVPVQNDNPTEKEDYNNELPGNYGNVRGKKPVPKGKPGKQDDDDSPVVIIPTGSSGKPGKKKNSDVKPGKKEVGTDDDDD